MEPWVVKYLPKSLNDVIGHKDSIEELKRFMQNKKHKAAIIYGPSGNGKTSTVYALANDMNYEVLEINASDFRDADSINLIVGGAAKQMSLFARGKIILVDEIDGLSGMEDRGGISALAKLFSESAFPIICTATNPFDKKFSLLRKKAELIEFKTLSYLAVFHILKKICEKENIQYEDDVLKQMARQVGGDVRAAINDLETISSSHKKLLKEDVEALGQREQERSMHEALQIIFKSTDPAIAIDAFENVNEEFDKIILWVDENLPKEYKKAEDLARAYECVSKADIYSRRIMRRQHWRYYVYINALLSAGIATAKEQKYNEFVKYGPTTRIFKLWMANMKYMKKKAIAEKIADATHTSVKEAMKTTIPYLQVMFKNDKKLAEQLAKEFELGEEEVAWLSR